MSPRPPLLLAIIAALLASGFALRAEGAIMSMSVTTSESMAVTSDTGGSEGDTSQRHENREQLSESDFPLPADSTGTSAPPGGSLSPILAAALESSLDLVATPQIATRLAREAVLIFPNPPLVGLLRPPCNERC